MQGSQDTMKHGFSLKWETSVQLGTAMRSKQEFAWAQQEGFAFQPQELLAPVLLPSSVLECEYEPGSQAASLRL